MSAIEVNGLNDVRPEEPLSNSRYTFEVVKQEVLKKDNGKMSWFLQYRCMNGPTQPDGSPSEDRRLTAFFSLNGYETMKDGGRFSKAILKSFLDAVGIEVDSHGSFEPEEAVGKLFDAITRIKENQDGVPEANINKYLPASN